MKSWIKNSLGLFAILLVILATSVVVRRFHSPGQLDVISAQAMDMSAMRPPAGAAPVALASVRRGSLADTITYTGSILALNEQDISPRITGRLVSLPFYPGDTVQAGQVVAQLDTAEVSAKADQATQEARQAQIGAQVAQLTHHLHHQAALEQASAQEQAAQQGVSDAQAEAQADQDAIADMRAGVQSAQANADYWTAEITREKQLADAGAVSRQDYQNELAQSQTAIAAVSQAQAKVRQALATAQSARAKVQMAKRQVEAAQASTRMAEADLAVAQGQALQAGAGASAAQAAAREAAVVESYARIEAPTDGIVTARPVSPGTLVQPGMTILRIAQIDRVRVQAHVAASDLGGIHPGTPVQITLQGSDGHSLAARVTSVFPAANDETRTGIVEAVVPNPGHRLLPGAFATMQIASGTVSDKLLVPASAIAAQGGSAFVWAASGGEMGAGQIYECVICHIHYSAAQAAKFHYIDPMEGGKLVPLRDNQAKAAPATGLTAHQVAVRVGASDGTWTEVASGALREGERVVTHGQAGLTEGARIVATPWGADGPQALPTAAVASHGERLYRCEKCGMTYSEADAQRNHFVDPMDGGKLTPLEDK